MYDVGNVSGFSTEPDSALSAVYAVYIDTDTHRYRRRSGHEIRPGMSQMWPLSFPPPAQFLQAMESAGTDNLITARHTSC